MDPKQIFEIIAIVLLIACSFFFSSAETAFSMASPLKLRHLCDEGNKRAILATKILNNHDRMLSSVLVGNNIVNISSSTISTTLLIVFFGSSGAGIATVIMTILLLIFGEITPKTLASRNPEKFAILYAPILNAVICVLTPIVFIIQKMADFFIKLFSRGDDSKTRTMTETELRAILDVSSEDGVIDAEENNMINNLIDFGDTVAKEVMTPRVDMVTINTDSSLNEIIETFESCKRSKLPVFSVEQQNVVGVLHSKDLLLSDYFSQDKAERTVFSVENFMKPAFFTFELQKCDNLFKDMQKVSSSIAFVLDEYGSLSGMITTSDLLEEIVGKLHDEHDKLEDSKLIKISDGVYKTGGSYKLDDINDELGTNLDSEDNDSIAGLIIEHLDRIPVAGDSITVDNLYITVIKTNNNRIDSVIIKKLEDENEESTDSSENK